ncbi:Domain of Uncharacterised Function (DUF349) [Capnocytophaga ochracea]|jgi:hypothetical protein|uniref:Domain of Uncharacterized Function (DUF349) n=1 Tax=Capnocytophaga ochracea TaxID=1018 RepID=A0A7Z9CAZ4_CAPOC|nr:MULTISPECIES: DUF349 domain-containing protein [Capnocytophaga]AVM54177.1 DUF349 domain-containing protein [Capnocytophaga sp. oral taxon 864]MEB3036527.1 DUF349 domain-containing protein [Capnocytophaga ochracea]VDG81170.1 Domain of Uncharacterised Function (DUF349) [Capnocytophaga ochracea]
MSEEKNTLAIEDNREDNRLEDASLVNYEAMSLSELTKELKELLQTEKTQAIKKQVDAIRYEFDKKYDALVEEKKEEFIADGGELYNFSYEIPVYREFYTAFNDYREKRNQYYKEIEKTHKENLAKRREIIEELKSLLNAEEHLGTTFKQFQQLQERWRKAGAVSNADYEDLWNTYHHHVENFYDFIHLSKDLRDIDFKRNLEEKLKIIERAEALAQDDVDALIASRELQVLHRVWKEEIGPVDKEHRESIWQRFSELTKKIHDKRQYYLKNLDKIYEENAVKKQGIIERIKKLGEKEPTTHSAWKQLSKQVEDLRQSFLNVGKVPLQQADEVWKSFNIALRAFNKKKNQFYKTLKKEQQENLTKKLALLEIAKANQNSTDWETTTELMKNIQREWKEIGSVPLRNTEKIWKEFKRACDTYFSRFAETIQHSKNKESDALEQKKAFLDKLKEYQLGTDRDKEIATLQNFVNEWNAIGNTHHSKRTIDIKFHKIIDALYKKLNFDKQEIELIKYNNKLERLINDDNENSLNNEVIFVRRRIDELKSEILQLENNLAFFGNIDEKNPLVRDVIKNINNQKEALKTWENKLRELKHLQKTQLAEASEEKIEEKE